MLLKNLEDSIQFAHNFASNLQKNDIILFKGDLGTGKTFICREIIRHLANDPNLNVTSPTFSLLNIYNLENLVIYHYDLYRLKHEDEIIELGIEEAFNQAICLIEWPEILLPLKFPYISVSLKLISENERMCNVDYFTS